MGLSSFERYMNSVGRIPLLTAEEEIHLSALIQQMLPVRAKQQAGKRLTAKERRILSAGLRAKDRMITANLRLVAKITSRFVKHCTGLTVDDLMQEGSVGLAVAAERFDGTRGYKFSTYAYWWIRQTMNRSMAATNRMIRLPYHIEDEVQALSKQAGRLSQELGRWPTAHELAKASGTPLERLVGLMDAALGHVSLDKPLNVGDTTMTFGDIIEDPASVEALERSELQCDAERLLMILDSMPADDRDAIRSYMGIGGRQESFGQMGKRYGITRSGAGHRFEKAMHRLKIAALADA